MPLGEGAIPSVRTIYAGEEKQQTRIPLKDKTAGAAPVTCANLDDSINKCWSLFRK